jgi:hypothetical protein
LHDAPLVFSALRKLNEIGYILDTPDEGSMLITSSGELRITAMHNVVTLPEDLEEKEKMIKKREEFCRRWVFGEMERRFGVGPRWRTPAHTRGKMVVPVQVLVPLNDPEKILSLGYSFNGSDQADREKSWAVGKFRDIWSSVHPDNTVEIWKLAKTGGIKRLLEADSCEESESETVVSCGRRPIKKLRKGTERERSETPLPQLPVAMEDLPLMPPSVLDIQEHGRDRSTSVTLFGSRSASPMKWESLPEEKPGLTAKNVPSWMLEGDWLALASTTRIEVAS